MHVLSLCLKTRDNKPLDTTHIFYKKSLIRNGIGMLNFLKVKKHPYMNLKAKKLL